MAGEGSVLSTPRIIYGTAWKKERTEALVRNAIVQGFRGIDTACQPKHYDEAAVGAAVAASVGDSLNRGDLYLQTKFTPVQGHDPRRIPYDPHADIGEQVDQSCKVSLRNLRTEYVDSLILHSPLETMEQTMAAWRAMESLQRSGSARQLGISNCYSAAFFAELYRSADVKPAVLQNRFHAESGYDKQLRAFCVNHAVVYQSFWTLTANPHLLAHPKMKALAVKYRCEPPQILFRYLTQNNVVPLTGTRSEAHMREDLAIFSFDLDASECEAIAALFE